MAISHSCVQRIRTFLAVFVEEKRLMSLIFAAVKRDSGKQAAEYNLVLNAGQTAELRSSHMGFGKWDGVT